MVGHSANTSVRQRRPLRGLIVLLCAAGSVFTCCLSGLSFSLPSRLPDTSALGTSVTASFTDGLEQGKPITTIGEALVGSSVPVLSRSGVNSQPSPDALSSALSSSIAATALTAVALSATQSGRDEVVKTSLADKLTLLASIGAWFFLNTAFNIYNKKALNLFPFPWAVALFQMAFGIFLVGPLWATGIRKAPKLSFSDIMTLVPSAIGHLVTHAGAAVSFSAGAVSFTQIVKASEPVASAMLNFLFAGEILSWQAYAALLPIVGGVGLASLSELSFTWLAFGAAMVSNIASALRSVYSKTVMTKGDIGEDMTPANFYAVMVILATLFLIPATYVMEGPAVIMEGAKIAYAKGGTEFLLNLFYSGFFYYVYNEVAFKALSQLDPVSHAVANTVKRVAIIVAAVVVFNTPVTKLGAIGSAIAILGTLGYSLAKTMFK